MATKPSLLAAGANLEAFHEPLTPRNPLRASTGALEAQESSPGTSLASDVAQLRRSGPSPLRQYPLRLREDVIERIERACEVNNVVRADFLRNAVELALGKLEGRES